MCVGNKSDLVGDQAIDGGRDVWTSWSLDHQLEYCECSALHDVFTGNRDTEGVERLVEALGSHTWSGFTEVGSLTAAAPSSTLAGESKEVAHSFDVRKWDHFVASQPDPEAEALARSELGKLRLERTCYDGEIEVDDDVERFVEEAQLNDGEVAVIQELLAATQHPDFKPDQFFRDPAVLASSIPGPNSALHLNLGVILPGTARVLQDLVQICKENPLASKLLVRSAIWCNMVDAGAGVGGGPKGVAAVPVLVPLALVWSVLESCAAETAGRCATAASLRLLCPAHIGLRCGVCPLVPCPSQRPNARAYAGSGSG
jgi:hypothetical protein